MTPRTPLRELGLVLERLLEEPDARRRERLLAHCVFDAGLASAVAMYAEGEPWQRLISCGATDGLPGAELVASVAAGDIGPELPPDRLVVVGGAAPRRRALVLAGGLGDEYRADLFEALLVFLSCLDSIDGGESDLDDRVLPPFQREAVGRRAAGADIAHDLRALLRSIRARQDELDLLEPTLDDEEREQLAQIMDQECQLAGDLLLDAFAEAEAYLPCGGQELEMARNEPSRWRRIFEEIACEHVRHLADAGCPLRISAIEPGTLGLVASEGDYRIAVEMLLDLAGRLRGEQAGDAPGVDASLLPLTRESTPGLQLCVETVRVAGEPQPGESTRVAALREHVERTGGIVRSALPARGAVRIAVWLPGA